LFKKFLPPDVANLEVAETVPMKATLLKMNPPSEQAHVVVRGTAASFIQEIESCQPWHYAQFTTISFLFGFVLREY